jgi:hypothetical protein
MPRTASGCEAMYSSTDVKSGLPILDARAAFRAVACQRKIRRSRPPRGPGHRSGNAGSFRTARNRQPRSHQDRPEIERHGSRTAANRGEDCRPHTK